MIETFLAIETAMIMLGAVIILLDLMDRDSRLTTKPFWHRGLHAIGGIGLIFQANINMNYLFHGIDPLLMSSMAWLLKDFAIAGAVIIWKFKEIHAFKSVKISG